MRIGIREPRGSGHMVNAKRDGDGEIAQRHNQQKRCN